MLLCTVRDCRLPLKREQRRLICSRNHSFDLARSGYVNLLQPQDSKSRNPGDSAEAVAARRRFHDRGFTKPLADAIAGLGSVTTDDAVLDAGCGDGFYLTWLAHQTGCRAHGVDISIPAINLAARTHPEHEWIVANADRFVPYSNSAFTLILSITARMNAPEFRRVLRDDGRLLVAVPAPADLIELRGAGRDRVARTIEIFEQEFTILDRSSISVQADLDTPAVEDVLLSIYRPLRKEPAGPAKVTLSLDLLLFRPRNYML